MLEVVAFVEESDTSLPKHFPAFIPHPIESEWDARWAPRLAGFPVNICYGAGRSTGIVRSTYYFDRIRWWRTK
jgi:hypothetical protein